MPKRYFSAEALDSDDFDIPFTHAEGELVYDAKTWDGRWATMTEVSFTNATDGKLGIGYGQKYIRQANGELWLAEEQTA